MKYCNMAVVVPVDEFDGSENTMCMQVWGQISNLLLPGLGKLYRQFHPTNEAWGHTISHPLGIVLGRQEPELFVTLLLAGQQAQQDAALFHAAAMIERAGLDDAQKIGNTFVCPVTVDGSDHELMVHALWHIAMQEGVLMPDCGIYYAALNRAIISDEESRAIAAEPARYAICMVRLSQEVQSNAEI